MGGITDSFDIKKVFDPLGLFTKAEKAETPAPAAAPAAPTDDAAASAQREEASTRERLRRTAGSRAQTVLYGDLLDQQSASARRQLLGS